MECILEAHPLPDILWFHADKNLKKSDRIKMVRKSTSKDVHVLSLEIREPTIEDGGAYRCNAVNLLRLVNPVGARLSRQTPNALEDTTDCPQRCDDAATSRGAACVYTP